MSPERVSHMHMPLCGRIAAHAETMPAAKDDPSTPEQRKARTLIEKKTVINLIEAFAVSVKHYLRGEEGVYYVDLYHLVKYLPSYALPPGMPSLVDVTSATSDGASTRSPLRHRGDSSAPHPTDLEHAATDLPPPSPMSATHQPGPLPFPATSPRKVSVQADLPMPRLQLNGRSKTIDERQSKSFDEKYADKASTYSGRAGGDPSDFLLPARMPPKYHLLDLFPFSLLVGYLTKRGREVKVSDSETRCMRFLSGANVVPRARRQRVSARSSGAGLSRTICHSRSRCTWSVRYDRATRRGAIDMIIVELVHRGAPRPECSPSANC